MKQIIEINNDYERVVSIFFEEFHNSLKSSRNDFSDFGFTSDEIKVFMRLLNDVEFNLIFYNSEIGATHKKIISNELNTQEGREFRLMSSCTW